MLTENGNGHNGKQVISEHAVPLPGVCWNADFMQTCHSEVSSLTWSLYPLQLGLLQVIAEVTSSLSLLSQLLNVAK